MIIGVNERGEKHFLAIEEGVRESTQNWREVLLGLKQQGLEIAPEMCRRRYKIMLKAVVFS